MANVAEFLPLSPPVYGILLTLGTSAMHGYGIILEFEKRTGQEGTLLPGSLYNTIARMVRDNLIDEVAASAEGDPRKRYYRATELGRTVARAESARLRTLLELAEEQNLADHAPA
jgi:DNA-binding PadR family transcriptional regulator